MIYCSLVSLLKLINMLFNAGYFIVKKTSKHEKVQRCMTKLILALKNLEYEARCVLVFRRRR